MQHPATVYVLSRAALQVIVCNDWVSNLIELKRQRYRTYTYKSNKLKRRL
jgi:hypothetical protein